MNTVCLVMIRGNEDTDWQFHGVLAVCHDEQVAAGLVFEVREELERLHGLAKESDARMKANGIDWGCEYLEVTIGFHQTPGFAVIDDDKATTVESILCRLQGDIDYFRIYTADETFKTIEVSVVVVPVVGIP